MSKISFLNILNTFNSQDTRQSELEVLIVCDIDHVRM